MNFSFVCRKAVKIIFILTVMFPFYAGGVTNIILNPKNINSGCDIGVATPEFNDLEQIISRGYIRIGYFAGAPPFAWREKGKLKGFDVDLGNEIAGLLGVSVKRVVLDQAANYDKIVELVEKDKVDIAISDITITLDRLKSVAFTVPYMNDHMALFVNRALMEKLGLRHGGYNDPRVTFAGVRGVKGAWIKRYYPRAKIKYYSSFGETYDAVLKGEVAVAMGDDYRLEYMLERNPAYFLAIKVVDVKGIPDNIAIAVNYQRWRLLKWLNFFVKLNDHTPTGVINRLKQKYIVRGFK